MTPKKKKAVRRARAPNDLYFKDQTDIRCLVASCSGKFLARVSIHGSWFNYNQCRKLAAYLIKCAD